MALLKRFLLMFCGCIFIAGNWSFAGEDLSGSDKIPDNTRWPMTVEPGKISITPVNTEQIKIPNLYRLTRAQAEQILEDIGLTSLFRTERPNDFTEYAVREYTGKVHAMSPEPGTWVKPGTQVIATLGPTDIVHIPYISGDRQDVAEHKITQAGLKFILEEMRYAVMGPYGVINWKPYDYCYVGDTVFVQIVYPEIPNLLGSTCEEAKQRCELAGLQCRQVGKTIFSALDFGHVSEQNPPAGSHAKPMDIVTVSVQIEVPNLLGLTPKEAKQRCELEGLQYRQVEKPILSALDFGHVSEQNPPAGSHAKPMDIVTAVFPKERSIVPDFILLDDLQVKELAAQIGVTYAAEWRRPPAVLYEHFSPVSVSGKVWKQDPLPWTEVAVGSEVKVVFGEENAVTIPGVYSFTEQEARKVFLDAGLSVEIRNTTQTYYAPRGVYQWEPRDYAYAGETIYIDVEYPEVPQLRGMTKKEAEEAINNAKLTPKVIVVDITDESEGVFEQDPLPGCRLNHGDTVSASIAISIM